MHQNVSNNLDYLPKPKPGHSQKLHRCKKFSSESELVPTCFRENTSKEELVLEHVLEYQKQFANIYDPHRPLLLAPRNEAKVLKFICTTIRPTKLPYRQLYTWEGCSKFLSDFLEYEELDPPYELPQRIPAPSNVLEWQAGDSFDFSIVLCSLLVGVGYDAYVIYGRAPRFITTKDESKMEPPEFPMPTFPNFNTEEIKPVVEEVKREINVDALIHKPDPKVFSEFKAEKKKKKDEENQQKWKEENLIDDDEPEFEKYDEFEGQRLHAWILLKKGKRELHDTFFLESTTGTKYKILNSPYINVEAIFNHKNFWINMQPERRINDINFDDFEKIENDPSQWEYVMLPPHDKQMAEKEADDELGAAADEGDSDLEEEAEEDILDLPPPWSPKLLIDRDAFDKLCPLGEKTVFYKKCKVDTYADYKQPDGLVQRITFYKDYKRHIIQEIRCFYNHRIDKLAVRRKFPFDFKTIEYFHPGKKLGSNKADSHLRKLKYIDARERILYYYPHRNKDGLVKRIEKIGEKTMEFYKSREDRLIYRSVRIDPDYPKAKDRLHLTLKDIHYDEVVITKMTEKFEKDEGEITEEDQIRKVVYDILDNKKISIFYHFKEGKVTALFREYKRDGSYMSKIDNMNDKDADKDSAYTQERQKAFQMEKHCHQEIRLQETSAEEELKDANKNEDSLQSLTRNAAESEESFEKFLEKNIYDKARDKTKYGHKKEEEEARKEDEKDYLAPVFEKLGIKPNEDLSPAKCREIKSEAFKMLKDRLLTRADIIQKRVDKESRILEAKYEKLVHKGDNVKKEDEEEYEKFFNAANFRIDILTERASTHYKNSLRKLEELDAKLSDDPRLKALHKAE